MNEWNSQRSYKITVIARPKRRQL